MYYVIRAHIDDWNNDFIKVVSKHRTQEAAKNAMVKKVAEALGFESVDDFKMHDYERYTSVVEKGKVKDVYDSNGEFLYEYWEIIMV